jgi:hypothetical protein
VLHPSAARYSQFTLIGGNTRYVTRLVIGSGEVVVKYLAAVRDQLEGGLPPHASQLSPGQSGAASKHSNFETIGLFFVNAGFLPTLLSAYSNFKSLSF